MMTFDTFVAGAASADALSAAAALARGDDRRPLVLLGPCGAGKSHLLHAIAHELRARRPEANVLRATAAELTDSLVASFRRDSLRTFEQRLAAFDAVLVDDMTWLGDKPVTEEEIIRQIETLSARGVPVVVASARPLCRPIANERVATLGYPDEPARLEIARRVAAEHGVPLQDDLASQPCSAPELRSRILRVVAEARFKA
jgi:chromosomal replication initiation ATPase DnaA